MAELARILDADNFELARFADGETARIFCEAWNFSCYPGRWKYPFTAQIFNLDLPEEELAEFVANTIEAPCHCFARPGEEPDLTCIHENRLAPWPVSAEGYYVGTSERAY